MKEVMKLRALLLLLLASVVPAACSPAGPDGGTATTTGEAPVAAVDPAIETGRNDDGTFYQGAADAPVTLIDYSDFL